MLQGIPIPRVIDKGEFYFVMAKIIAGGPCDHSKLNDALSSIPPAFVHLPLDAPAEKMKERARALDELDRRLDALRDLADKSSSSSAAAQQQAAASRKK